MGLIERHAVDIARAVITVLVCTAGMVFIGKYCWARDSYPVACASSDDHGKVVFETSYRVDNGRLGELCVGTKDDRLQRLWEKVEVLTPPQHLKYVTELSTFREHPTQSRGAAAFTQQVSAYPRRFRLSFNAASERDEAFEWVIVAHEYGHVLANRGKQTQPLLHRHDRCAGYFANNTCWRNGSLIDEWVKKFWTQEQINSLQAVDRPLAQQGRCDHDAGFITRYAASSPNEDFAESFAAMVLGHQPNNEQEQARIDWLASVPELRQFRDRAQVAGIRTQQIGISACGTKS